MSVTSRICKKLIGSSFEEVEFDTLRKGDLFMLFEPTGELVKDQHSNTVFTAISDPYVVDGVCGIKVQE